MQYRSYSNYEYSKRHNINNFVKYSLWRQKLDGLSIPLFYFNKNKELICLNNKKAIELEYIYGRHPKTKNGKFYKITNCNRCPYKEICRKPIKDKKSR